MVNVETIREGVGTDGRAVRIIRDTWPGSERPRWRITTADGGTLSEWPQQLLAQDAFDALTGQSRAARVAELGQLSAALTEAREAEARASEALAAAIRAAIAAGVSLYRVEQVTGLARATVRRWAGVDA